MTLERFWYQHADAAGAALIVAVLAVIALILIIRRYERLARGQRTVYRIRLTEQRKELHDRYAGIIRHLTKRPRTLDEHNATAVAVTRPQPLADAYVFGQTIADVPSPYTPTFYRGSAR